MRALLLVDMQNDFLSGGALPIEGADHITPIINEIIHEPFDWIIATKDWHPFNHGSFANNHEGKHPGDHINLGGLDQVLWPAHCVQGTKGAEFAPGWDCSRVDQVIYKGTDPLVDSYSAFYDNSHRKSTGLEIFLREKGISTLFIAGLATDYCVKYSALDGLALGFHVYVITDACRGVNSLVEDSKDALALMGQGGATLISYKDLKDILQIEDKKGRDYE